MPKPLLQALILADHVYQDAQTGKKVIAGTFNQLFYFRQDKPPTPPPPPGTPRKFSIQEMTRAGSPYAYISLTDVRGNVPLQLRYVDLSTNATLLHIDFQVRSEDPLSTIEAVVPVPPLPTPHAGAFALELFTGEEPLGSIRITAVDKTPPRPEPPPAPSEPGNA